MTNATPLSPAAQAVLDAFWEGLDSGDDWDNANIAAALRAAAARSEAVEIRTAPGMLEFDEVIRVSDILAIASELEGQGQLNRESV